jgi:hypothetical protein
MRNSSLLHIPALVIHGNSLSLEEFGRWYTPAHIMGGWSWKLRRETEGGHQIGDMPEPPKPQRPAAPSSDETPGPLQLDLF